MRVKDPYKVIQKPIITEKAAQLREKENVYMFYVHPRATKDAIKRSVEKLFSVDVIAVRTINLPGKPRRRGRFIGRTAARKKAIVKLKEGQTIPVFEGLA